MACSHEGEKYCIFCGEWVDERKMREVHIIPKSRGGCKHKPNLIWACLDCKRSKKEFTPLEWWAEMKWKNQWQDKNGKPSVCCFDANAWELEEQQYFLLELAYYEARARWHMRTAPAHKDKELPNWGNDKEV